MANNSQANGTQFWPPAVGSHPGSSLAMQFRSVGPPQQGQHFVPPGSQQFRPVGQGISAPNVGMPGGQSQPMPFSQPMQPLPPRPTQGNHPSSQPIPMPYVQSSRPLTSGPLQSQHLPPQVNNQMPGLGAPGMPISSSYTFQPPPQLQTPPASVAGQPWSSSGGSQGAVHASVTPPVEPTANTPSSTQQSTSDWQEHTAPDGRRYYYNKKTKQSSWEKPFELMTPIERADASTVWKEFSTPEGKKYYYNKVTKESVWLIPEELKLAREQAQKAMEKGAQLEASVTSHAAPASSVSLPETSTSVTSATSGPPTFSAASSSPLPVPPVAVVANSSSTENPGSSGTNVTSGAGAQPPMTPPSSVVTGTAIVNANTTPVSTFGNTASQDVGNSADGASMPDIEEAKGGMVAAGKTNATTLEENTVDDEPLVYANKQEAKNAFKALLESANVQSDWTWEQAMREIIKDKRYGALKTLGERKQAFNEYLGQRKKIEAEERRMRQKKAREEFTKMLEECTELTSTIKWSKAVSMFENDERFKAVERARDREDLFDNYIVELERKEKERAAEERRQNIAEYRKFLESCDFIKVNSQWRKVQDRLEDNERCARLDKIDRLLVFQDYIRDLEKEEEEQKKIQKEQLRRSERKNRDEFRKMMEEHIAAGILTAKTHWREYCSKVKDLPQYFAVASNTSGSTPKDLFEDVTDELEKQYHEDKNRIKDAIKSAKVTIVSTWTFEDFKTSILEDIGSPPISDINFKLVYEELLERAKEKEEKEAKKRQRLADDFSKLLHTFKEITVSSDWEECKQLFEDAQEYRSIGEESVKLEIFEEYIAHLQEKAKEKERKREEEKAKKEKEREEKEKRKEKERKEKEREREKDKTKERYKKDETDSETADIIDGYGHKEDKKREKDKDRKHRKRHLSSVDDDASDKEEKEETKKSRRHGSDRKKSRKHSYTPESDSESRHKRHKRDHRDGSRRNGGYEELEDGEVGEDGEIQ